MHVAISTKCNCILPYAYRTRIRYTGRECMVATWFLPV